jgi:cobalt-zinc-cadmium resistance protein CzcA
LPLVSLPGLSAPKEMDLRQIAIAIAGRLIADLVMSVFLLPALFVWMARDKDVLPGPETKSES